MSASETSSSTPHQTPTPGDDSGDTAALAELTTQNMKFTDSRAKFRSENPEPLSLLAESQRLQREMLRVELSEGVDLPPASRGSEVSPVLSMNSPTRTRIQLLEAELLENKRKVSSLQEGNQRHQKLIQTLQGQLAQYKRKNTDLEMEVEDLKLEVQKNAKKLQSKEMEHDSRLDARESMAKMREESLIAELENLTSTLEAERNKSAEFSRANEVLQDQLEEAAAANQGLSRDVAQLTQAWRQATQQLEKREVDWQNEETAFNEYFATEHNRLLALWREVVGLRRAFAELRHHTARDFTQMSSEIMRTGQSLQSACSALGNNLKAAELESADALAKSRRQLMAEEADAKARSQSLAESLERSQARLVEAEDQIMQLNRRVQELMAEVADKDRVLNTLQRLRASLPSPKHSDAEGEPAGEDPVAVTKRLIEQTRAMHQALSQIAQTVLADTANADVDEAQEPFMVSFQHQMETGDWVEDEAGVLVTPRSRRPRSTSPSSEHHSPQLLFALPRSPSIAPPLKLAATTVSAVQSALNRRATQVQALRLKLSSLRGRFEGMNKRFEESEGERTRLVEHAGNLRSDLDLVRKEVDSLRVERDKIKHALSISIEERNILERARATNMEQINSLQAELEQFRQLLYETSKERDGLVEQRNAKQLEYESKVRETTRLQRTLEQAETRISQLREELSAAHSAEEQLEKRNSTLSNDYSEVTGKLERLERRISELTEQLDLIQQEKQKLQDKVIGLESIIEAREYERSELTLQLNRSTSNETRALEERNHLRAEVQQVRNQLSRSDAELQLSSAELERLRETLARMEQQHLQTEAETLRANRERAELAEEVAAANRQVSNLTEEAETLRREVGQQAGVVSRLNEEREEMMRDKDDLSSRLSLNERERRQLSDLVARLRADREVLDNEAFLAQRQITELKNKAEKQETDIANLTLRRNTLQAEVQRLRSDFETELSKIQRQRDRLGAKYTAEVEELRANLATAEQRLAEAEEAAVQAVLRADRAAAEATKASILEAGRYGMSERESQRWAEEQARLNHELLLAQRERDDALMRAEQERQKILALAAEDHATVRERILLLQETITDLEKTLDRTRREAASRAEKDDVALKTTTEDLRACREQFEEFKASHEKEVLGLKAEVKALESSLERTVHEYNEVQLQLRLCEEPRYTNRSEYSETAKILRETEESRNNLRREVVDLRKQLKETESAKCALEVTVQEMRRQMRELEAERGGQSRILNEMRERLESSECEQRNRKVEMHSPLAISRPRDDLAMKELRQKLSECELVNSRLQQKCAELRTNLGEEIANLEEVKRECVMLKKQLAEEEAVRHNLETELGSLQRRHADAEDRLRAHKWTTGLSTEEANRDCKRLEEVKRILQSRLETSEQANARLNADLTSAQRRLQALQLELTASSESRMDAESRLASIHSLMRRLLGFRQRQGSLPVLMLNSKKRNGDIDDNEMMWVEDNCDGHSNYQHHLDRRSRSISPNKKHNNSDSRSHSADRRAHLPPTGWSEAQAEGGVIQKTTVTTAAATTTATTGTTIISQSLDSPGQLLKRRTSPASPPLHLGADLDPDAVSFSLREVLRQMEQMEKERDDAVMAKHVNEEKLFNVTSQLNEKSDEAQQLRQILRSIEEEQKSLSEQLRKSHDELLNKETELRRMKKERDVAFVRVEELQRRLKLMEEECKVIQDRLNASKNQEAKAAEDHRRELRKSLEEAEARLASAESARRSLQADLHRQRTITSDKSTEIQTLKSRLESTQSEMSSLHEKLAEARAAIDRLGQQCEHAAQRESEARTKAQRFAERVTELEQENAQLQERLSSAQRLMTSMDHDNRLLQERLENTQTSLRDCKEQLEQVNTRIQKLQGDLTEADLVRCDLEAQNRQLTRQKNDQEILQKDLTQQIISIKLEKENTQTKLDNLLKNRKEWEKMKGDLEFEVSDLKEKLKELHVNLDHVTRERLREKELNSVIVSSQEDVRKRTQKLEEENLDYRRQIQRLSAQLALREESHASRLDELLRQRHAQMETELEKKSVALLQCEKALKAKEMSHCQRVKTLEEQIRMLNDQLSHEANRRQLYMSTSRLPIESPSVTHYPSASQLSHTMAQSHESLANPREFSSSPEGVNTARPPRAPQPQSTATVTTTVLAGRAPTVDAALSVSVQTESRPTASTSGTQTPSIRIP
ncbi:Rootletin [Echinococcus granulosus]|uniref:Rootletin n=1 Tax=Echinococcus granulosus TaxID=6210 RepID=A0A068X1N1_ECHGR|nr:Rootletin [Echinococcus granulosus]CDS23873.1 Rootletin [Echinococcus granulosus]